jgi:ubiquinone biosynthesis protein COQ9
MFTLSLTKKFSNNITQLFPLCCRKSGPEAGQMQGAMAQKKLLEATLPFVATYGWTTESISLGAQTLGYPSIAHGLFPNGPADLIDHFLEDCRLRLEKEMQFKRESGELDK